MDRMIYAMKRPQIFAVIVVFSWCMKLWWRYFIAASFWRCGRRLLRLRTFYFALSSKSCGAHFIMCWSV